MKTIVVKVPAGEKQELQIEPGTAAADILAHLGLEDYRLRRPGSEEPDDVFGPDENVYTEVQDGDVLQAVAKMPVG